MCEKYNGYTNYDTWLVKLWIDNEKATQDYWLERTKEALREAVADKTFTKEERAMIALADALKEEHEEAADDLKDVTGVFKDLLAGALSSVNWQEIAGDLIRDLREAPTGAPDV